MCVAAKRGDDSYSYEVRICNYSVVREDGWPPLLFANTGSCPRCVTFLLVELYLGPVAQGASVNIFSRRAQVQYAHRFSGVGARGFGGARCGFRCCHMASRPASSRVYC